MNLTQEQVSQIARILKENLGEIRQILQEHPAHFDITLQNFESFIIGLLTINE